MLHWADKMDRVLTRTIGHFGRSGSHPSGPCVYQRAGYDTFELDGILEIDARLASVDLGKYYGVTFRLADFANATFAASVTLTFSDKPGNNNTVTFDGVTYTFKSVIGSAPNEVWRADTALDCAKALAYAINADPAYAGSWYTSATEAHPTCLAVQNGQSVRVEYRTKGIAGNNKIASESLYNASLDSKLFYGGGPVESDEVIIDGLTYKVGDVGYDAEGGVTLRLHTKNS